VLYYVGFYSQQSPAPNSLDLEYGFTTFVAPNCPYVQLWDGDSVGADTKESVCASFLFGQETIPQQPGFDASFSVEDICNNLYGYGAGTMCATFHESYFCPGVTYDVMVWEIEVNVLPNGPVTSEDIACLDLYLDESGAGVLQSAFTFPGLISNIAPPQIIISGTCYGDGVYTGTNNPVTINCTDTVTFDYDVTPGCNFTESVAAYFDINATPTFGGGATHPFFWGLDVDDWFIFFANNIVDGQGNPIPYVGINQFFEFPVPQNHEICIMAQDPCNGKAAVTCVQFQVLTYTDPIAAFDTLRHETCDSLVVDFVNNSTNADGWFWDFGNGLTSTAQHPLPVAYNSAGTYTVTLTAIDSSGCEGDCTADDVMSVTVSFNPPVPDAMADFEYEASGCDSLVVAFTNESSGHTGSFWNFDNGMTSTDEHPTVVYDAPGTYNVMLVALDSELCMVPDTAFTTIVFDANPHVSTSFTASQSGTTVQFTNTSINCTDFEWDFGDGNMSTDENPTHTYANPGDYTVILLCSNYCDADTMQLPITVTGVDAIIGGTHLHVAPNPTYSRIWLDIVGGAPAQFHVTLSNTLGETITTETLEYSQAYRKDYDLSSLPAQVYWLTIHGLTGHVSFKIMKM
jgi:PKD repeat protein